MSGVKQAVLARRSVRAFVPNKVPPMEEVLEVLRLAHRAPSGGNVQPWKVHVVAGAVRDAIVAEVAESVKAGVFTQGTEYNIYPPDITDPYKQRRTNNGQQLYDTIGIPKSDTRAKLRQVAKNWEFFGAPIGLFFVVDRQHGPPQWADIGMYIQTVLLLAAEKGWATCPQGSLESGLLEESRCGRTDASVPVTQKRRGRSTTSPCASTCSSARTRCSFAASRSGSRTRRPRSTSSARTGAPRASTSLCTPSCEEKKKEG